jgi:DNA-binding protein HU-beta
MNKTELIERVAQKTGLTMKDAKNVVDAIFSTQPKNGIIANELKSGRKVQITGFGTFETRKRKAREGRNPQTGATIGFSDQVQPATAVH